jgi:hypothetical protein
MEAGSWELILSKAELSPRRASATDDGRGAAAAGRTALCRTIWQTKQKWLLVAAGEAAFPVWQSVL